MTLFLPGRQRIGAHALCVQHTPTAAALSTSFLLNHAPDSPELNALITRFRKSYSSVRISRESKNWRNQGATGWILAMHWYITWVKKMWFSCFSVLPGSVEAHVIWGGKVKRLLIAYFISNISAKEYQNALSCVKVRGPIANQKPTPENC